MVRWRLPVVAAALLLAACGGTTVPDNPVLCFPPEARRWISASLGNAAANIPDGPIRLYVDGSASMAGFIKGETRDERLLADLIAILPAPEIAGRSPVAVTLFDRGLTPVKPGEVATLQRAAAYLCPASEPHCAHQESHIDQALADAAKASADTLSLVVTDLWLDNASLGTTDSVAMNEPLYAILASGRSIAIFGFDSPYDGRVEGLPSGRRDVFVKRHHLFLLAAGPKARVEGLRGALARASSAAVARQVSAADAKYALFTLDPAVRLAADPHPLEVPANGSLTPAPGLLTIRQGIQIQELALAGGAARRRAGQKDEPPARWRGVSDKAITPGAVWSGPAAGRALIFRGKADACGVQAWQPYGELRGAWGGGPAPGFTLDPAAASTQLAPGVNLVVGELRRTSLASPNPATAWMRAWSFDKASEAQAITAPVMPVLNLAETARVLEAALARAAEARPAVVGGFAVAIRVDE